jgi:hypothetical protein
VPSTHFALVQELLAMQSSLAMHSGFSLQLAIKKMLAKSIIITSIVLALILIYWFV